MRIGDVIIQGKYLVFIDGLFVCGSNSRNSKKFLLENGGSECDIYNNNRYKIGKLVSRAKFDKEGIHHV